MKTELTPDRTNAATPRQGRGINGSGMSGSEIESIPLPFIPLPSLAPRRGVSFFFASLLVCVLVLIPAAGRAATNDLTALLQQGLFEEQANRNLDAAIEDYTALAKQFDKDRQLAATAVFRLGECFRAQGKTNEAAAHYQRILREFPDQTTLVTLSQQDLTGMGMGATTVNPGRFQQRLNTILNRAGTEAAGADSKVQLWKRIKDLPAAELEKVLPTVANDNALNDLLARRNEAQQKRATLVVDYATNSIAVERVDVLVVELNRQIADRISGVMQGLKLQAETASAAQPAGDARQQQKELLAKQITLAEQDLAEAQQRVQVGMATTTSPRTAEREVLRLRQQLAALDSSKAELLDLSVPASSDEDQEIARIQTMIQNSPDLINAPGEGGSTPLNKAAYAGWLKVAAFLLDHGADVNAGGTPSLNWAATAGNRAMTELLLSRGANVNGKGSQGKASLHIAVEKNFPTVAEVLLANKADVSAQDDFGNTPLVSATENKQVKLIQALLAAGANPNLENKNGRTPFSFAAASGSPELVKMFLAAKADPNGGRLDAPLLVAIHAGDVVSAELLLQAGAHPNPKTEDDWQPNTFGAFGRPVGRGSESPIHLAVVSGQLPMVNLLLKFKADPNDSQTDGQPVLLKALADTNVLAALLEHGANPNVTSGGERYSPLMSAAVMGNVEAVSLLLKHKADPNAMDSNGNTALLDALQKPNSAAVRALLAGGANPDTKTANGYPPLVLAVANTGNQEVLAALIAGKANVNATDPDGKAALHWAAEKNRQDLVELLVKAGADVNLRTKSGTTPLDYAKSYSKPTMPIPGGIPRPPVSYQWFNNSPGQTATATTTNITSIADLLRQKGALDELPDFTRIRITRQGLTQPLQVFSRGPKLTNQFTLLETVMRFYSLNSVYVSSQGSREAWVALPFPDFGRIIIRRPSAQMGGKEQEIKVSLVNSSNVVDCARDMPVQFGDEIEIPESVHALNAGIPNPVREMEAAFERIRPGQNIDASVSQGFLAKLDSYRAAALRWECLQKSVQLLVAGETTSFKINSWKEGFLSQALGKTEARSALRSSSDLSRVKVTRKTGNSAKPAIFTVDVSNGAPGKDDLWLQAGDVIEVPEKQ